MKCWWCNVQTLDITSHCKNVHEVTSDSNLLLKTYLSLYKKPSIVQTLKDTNGIPCFKCGTLLTSDWNLLIHFLKYHPSIGRAVQNGSGNNYVLNHDTYILDKVPILSELPLKVYKTPGDVFTCYEFIAKRIDFPEEYGWEVSDAVDTFLSLVEIELGPIL